MNLFFFISVGEVLCQPEEGFPTRSTDLQEMQGLASCNSSRSQTNSVAGNTVLILTNASTRRSGQKHSGLAVEPLEVSKAPFLLLLQV